MLKISNLIVAISTLLSANSAIASEFVSATEVNIANSCQSIFINPKLAQVNNTSQPKPASTHPPQTSIWWAEKQFDPFDGKLIQEWLAYPKKQQINIIVNLQLWSLLDYFARYRFVNQFGTVLRKYGYSLNILNRKQQCLATYKYNPISNPPKWELHLEKLGEDSLQIDVPKHLQL